MMASPKPGKDRSKPKGAMTAYACFVQVIREEHKKKHPGEQIVFSEFSKKCGERWKSMSAKEKKRFDDMAAVDKERFNNEMTSYIPPDGIKKGKKRKMARDPLQPKRPWSAFFFFCDEFRGKIKQMHPEWKVADIAKELGRRWEECQDKPKYETLAQQDKLRYEEDMAKFRAGTYVQPKQPRTADMYSNSGDGAGGSVGTENGGEVDHDDGIALTEVTSTTGGGLVDDDDDDEDGDPGDGDFENESGIADGSAED